MVGIAGINLNIAGALSQIFNLVLMLLMAAIGLIAVFVWSYLGKFKHKFRVKEVINNRKIIIDDKAREFKDKDGTPYWHLLKLKDKIPVPPPEAIEIDQKGKKCVEAYKTATGEFIFCCDKNQIKELPQEIKDIKDAEERKLRIKQWQKENNTVDAFQPLSTNQRLILIKQVVKAQEKRTKKWQDYIMPVVGAAALTVIVVALMVFYADMGKPLLQMADKINQNEQLHKDQLELMKEINNDIQIIKEETKPTIRPPN